MNQTKSIKGDIVESKKIRNVYGGKVKGKKEFLDKLEKAYDVLFNQGIRLDIGDSARTFAFQRQAYIENEAAKAAGKRVPNKAHPCLGYHARGQAIDLAQTNKDNMYPPIGNVKSKDQLKDITSHGKIYKALYDAGLRRIGNEWWHWSIGETNHTINQRFEAYPRSPADKKNINIY